MKKRDSLVSILLVSFVSVFVLSIIAYGALSKTYTFVAGTVITAAEVNDNFDDLFNAIGNQLYDEENYIADDQSVTTSINALDIGVNTLSSDAVKNKGKVIMVTGDGIRVLSDWLDQDTLTFDSASHKAKVNETFSPVPRGYISGVSLTNYGATSIFVSTGVARSTNDAYNIKLTNRVTKDLALARTGDGSLAPGGLASGAIAAQTGYHVWLYKHSSWTTGDVTFAKEAETPQIPYGIGRRIGWLTTDAASQIKTFDQIGNFFFYKNPELSIKDASLANGASTTYTLNVPKDVRVNVHLNVRADGAANRGVYFTNPSVADIEPSNTLVKAPFANLLIAAAANTDAGGQVTVTTNTAGQVRARAVSGAVGLYGMVVGWEDFRGQED